MGKIIVLVGPPNSGKTIWANKFLEQNKNYVKISRDDFRQMFRNQWIVTRNIENLITEIQYDTVNKFLESGLNVILDNTHCKFKYIEEIINRYSSNYDIIFKVFDIDPHTLFARNEYRSKLDGKYIPDTVMENMINNFQELKNVFNFKDIVH